MSVTEVKPIPIKSPAPEQKAKQVDVQSGALQFEDRRPESVVQKKIQKMADAAVQMPLGDIPTDQRPESIMQQKAQDMANYSAQIEYMA